MSTPKEKFLEMLVEFTKEDPLGDETIFVGDPNQYRQGNNMKLEIYVRTNIAEARPYQEGETLPTYVSISEADRLNGSPRVGDMIARNPLNHADQWLIAEKYFAENFAKASQ